MTDDECSDRSFLTSVMYGDNTRLATRLRAWELFGKNREQLVDWLTAHVCARAKSCIDVGCGTGEMIDRLFERQLIESAVLVDLAPRLLASAAARNQGRPLSAVVADVQQLPFDKSFDLVCAIQVLHHVSDPAAAVRSLVGCASAGGTILVSAARHYLDQGLNRLHYHALDALQFPTAMRDTTAYARWSAETAGPLIAQTVDTFFVDEYHNELCFYSSDEAWAYYVSAMMFRGSVGRRDPRISAEQWQQLGALMRDRIRQEIATYGEVRCPADVVLFTIPMEKQGIGTQLACYLQDHAQRVDRMPTIGNCLAASSVDLCTRDIRLIERLTNRLVPGRYGGITVGLTQFHDGSISTLSADTRRSVNGAHGSSIKAALRGDSYETTLKRDLAVIEQLPTDTIVNYDLFCGLYTTPVADHTTTRVKNLHEIARRLDCEPHDQSIMQRIVDAVYSVLPSDVRIAFEIPGTYGYSMMPVVTDELGRWLAAVVERRPNVGVCIDTAHLFTWVAQGHYERRAILRLLKKYGHLVTMLHIASAGCGRPTFRSAYRQMHSTVANWESDGLDSSLPLDEIEQAEIIAWLRRCCPNLVVEICESRRSSTFIHDYFPRMYHRDDDEQYERELAKQAECLGYSR